jgi:pimeloyl-ACP methyl ester carboxylesterase
LRSANGNLTRALYGDASGDTGGDGGSAPTRSKLGRGWRRVRGIDPAQHRPPLRYLPAPAVRPLRRRAALDRTTSDTGELTRDEILDNIMLYWLTNTGVSASRLYWAYKGGFFNGKGVSIPMAVSVFPGEQYQAPRRWAEQAYPNLIYFNEVGKGGHFAAWEQPELFASEVRAAFRSLR